jgi:hypothetical protein
LNFKNFFKIIVLILIAGCGVKSDPIVPPDSFQLLDPAAKYQYHPDMNKNSNDPDDKDKQKTEDATDRN